MMKIGLGISLLLNLVLAYFVFNKKTEKEIVERLIIETHAEGKQEALVEIAAPEKVITKEKAELTEFVPPSNPEFQEAGEKMESDRTEFFTEKLGMSEEKIAKHNQLREDFLKKISSYWKNNSYQEPTIKVRREMLTLEEEYQQKLEKLHGKKNWERYQKYRDEYNSQGLKRQMEDNQPFIFMNL